MIYLWVTHIWNTHIEGNWNLNKEKDLPFSVLKILGVIADWVFETSPPLVTSSVTKGFNSPVLSLISEPPPDAQYPNIAVPRHFIRRRARCEASCLGLRLRNNHARDLVAASSKKSSPGLEIRGLLSICDMLGLPSNYGKCKMGRLKLERKEKSNKRQKQDINGTANRIYSETLSYIWAQIDDEMLKLRKMAAGRENILSLYTCVGRNTKYNTLHTTWADILTEPE